MGVCKNLLFLPAGCFVESVGNLPLSQTTATKCPCKNFARTTMINKPNQQMNKLTNQHVKKFVDKKKIVDIWIASLFVPHCSQ